EGRLILGVGIAADVPNIRQEFTAAGVPFEKRVGRLLEGLRLARLLWGGETVDWGGRWESGDGHPCPKPYSQGGGPRSGTGACPRSGSADRCPQASIAPVAYSTAGCRSPRMLSNGLACGTRSRKSHAQRGAIRTR